MEMLTGLSFLSRLILEQYTFTMTPNRVVLTHRLFSLLLATRSVSQLVPMLFSVID